MLTYARVGEVQRFCNRWNDLLVAAFDEDPGPARELVLALWSLKI